MAQLTGDHLGNHRLLYIDDVAVGCTTNMSLSATSEEIDATCKDNFGAYQFLPGQQKVSISVAGNQVFDNAVSIDDLMNLWANRTEIEVRLSTANVGDVEYVIDGYISNISFSDDVNAVAAWEATITGTGQLQSILIA